MNRARSAAPAWTAAALALAAVFPAAARASEAPDRVDVLVQAERERQKIPGLALAVVRDGQVRHGARLRPGQRRAPGAGRPETIFQSGSVGKQFTAAAVMMLVEDGQARARRLRSRKYFPDAPAAWKDITVRHLLTHTSGIVDYGEESLDYRRDYTEDELVQAAYRLGLDFAPGSRWSYSNTGYVLLGVLVHKVAGQLLRRRPAGARLRAARDEDGARDQRGGHRAQPRRRLPAGRRKAREPGVGLAVAQHHRRRLALPDPARPRRLGQGAARGRAC